MKFLIFSLSAIISVLLTSSTVIQQQDNYELTIQIEEISIIKGNLYIAIYDSKEQFKNKKAIFSKHLKVTNAKIDIKAWLPKGEYAVLIYQDLNNNQELDKLFSIPLEPYGISNNIKGFPSFEDAKFTFSSNKRINIKIKN